MQAECNVYNMVSGDDEWLVKKTVRRVQSQYYGSCDREREEELYHFGIVGLIEAKKKFKADKGIPFQAFAVHRIKGAMIDYMRTAPVVRLPQKKQNLRKELEQARIELQRNGYEASDPTLAEKLGWTLGQVRQVAAMQPKVISIASGGHTQDENSGEAEEKELPAAGSGPEQLAIKRELSRVVQQCLERIKDTRDRLILVSRVFEERKLRELADGLDCTIETVRLRQIKAMESMKRCLSSHGWDEDSVPELLG